MDGWQKKGEPLWLKGREGRERGAWRKGERKAWGGDALRWLREWGIGGGETGSKENEELQEENTGMEREECC